MVTKLILLSTLCVSFFLLLITCVSNTDQPRTARVVAVNASLRQTPSDTGLVESEVPEGMVVKILDEKLPWYVVRVGDRVGWMHEATLLFGNNVTTTTSEREPVRVSTPAETYPVSPPTRSTQERAYIRGPRGGCYYISGSGRKVYVDRSMCN
jgi:hypothetical protein